MTHSDWSFDAAEGCWIIDGRECRIYIEPRPYYCDRGNFIAKIDARGGLGMSLDDKDLWPRYHFDLGYAKAECYAWLAKRKQLLAASQEPASGPAPKSIDMLFAFIAHADDGGEGLVAGIDVRNGLAMPLVGADMARIDSLRPIARLVATETRRPVTLSHFTSRRDVQLITPQSAVFESLVDRDSGAAVAAHRQHAAPEPVSPPIASPKGA